VYAADIEPHLDPSAEAPFIGVCLGVLAEEYTCTLISDPALRSLAHTCTHPHCSTRNTWKYRHLVTAHAKIQEDEIGHLHGHTQAQSDTEREIHTHTHTRAHTHTHTHAHTYTE